jgi:large subunit ribosomal protein L20
MQSRETNPSCYSCISASGWAAFVSSLELNFFCQRLRNAPQENRTMPRVKRGTKRRARRKKLLKHAKGFFLTKGKLYRSAKEAVNRSLRYTYRDRRVRKRDYRALWIQRIGAAARNNGTTYSQLIHALKAGGIDLDRKILADMAVHDADGFASLVGSVKQHFPKPGVVQTARAAVVRHHEEG